MFALVKNTTVTKPNSPAMEVEQIILFAEHSIFEDKFGTQHSPETLIGWTADQKQDHGIYDVAYGERGDDRFYSITEDTPVFDSDEKIVKISYTKVARDLEDPVDGVTLAKGLKTQFVSSVKASANELLSATDWMLVRKIERSVDIPEATVAHRGAVVAEANRLETAITACTDVEELIEVVNSVNWPVAE